MWICGFRKATVSGKPQVIRKNLRLRSKLYHAQHGKGAVCRNFNCVHRGTYLAMSMWTFYPI